MMDNFFPLRIRETFIEIDGHAKTLVLDVPEILKNRFYWRAGQHLSVRLSIRGKEYRRSYSISSSPVSGDPLRITVKRVKGGCASNYINDNLDKNDQIEVMPPYGSFCLDPGKLLRRTHYFFAAGSGITPVYSMLHSVVSAEPYSTVNLIYGNRTADHILFSRELSKLASEHTGRVIVKHVLSAPSVWSGFRYWKKGKIDSSLIGAFIDECPPYAQDAQYYICGPGAMNNSVKNSLRGLDVPVHRIHMESFGSVIEVDDSVEGMMATAEVRLNGKSHDIDLDKGQTILDAVRNAGLNPPYSCQSGVCGACKAELIAGDVHMKARMALEEGEISNGAILTCQSIATSPDIVVSYRS